MRCHGTRWITHKQKALQRVIDIIWSIHTRVTCQIHAKTHLLIKAADKSRIRGYLKQWSTAKMLLGSATVCILKY